MIPRAISRSCASATERTARIASRTSGSSVRPARSTRVVNERALDSDIDSRLPHRSPTDAATGGCRRPRGVQRRRVARARVERCDPEPPRSSRGIRRCAAMLRRARIDGGCNCRLCAATAKRSPHPRCRPRDAQRPKGKVLEQQRKPGGTERRRTRLATAHSDGREPRGPATARLRRVAQRARARSYPGHSLKRRETRPRSSFETNESTRSRRGQHPREIGSHRESSWRYLTNSSVMPNGRVSECRCSGCDREPRASTPS